jgi:hypothetical protein
LDENIDGSFFLRRGVETDHEATNSDKRVDGHNEEQANLLFFEERW